MFYAPGAQIAKKGPVQVCTGPVTYVGQAELKKEIDVTIAAAGTENVFLTSTAPARSIAATATTRTTKTTFSSWRRRCGWNTKRSSPPVSFCRSTTSGCRLYATGSASPWGLRRSARAAPCGSKRSITRSATSRRIACAITYAGAAGTAPHAYDLELERIVDLVLAVKAQAFLIEGANARHEHEVAVWHTVKLPPGKILIPSVVTHSTDVVEHRELVSQRLQRNARRLGKDNLIAGADCGFGGRSDPQIAWAKLRAMVKGAALASKARPNRHLAKTERIRLNRGKKHAGP